MPKRSDIKAYSLLALGLLSLAKPANLTIPVRRRVKRLKTRVFERSW